MMDAVLHVLGGFLVGSVLVVADVPRAWVVSALFWFGLFREWYQHGHPPSTWHQVLEAVTWPVGAVLAALLF